MKFLLMALLSFLLVGCGIICPSKPPERAIMESNGTGGMHYHFSMYESVGDAKHTPSLRCIKYEYGKSHIYTNNLGSVNGDSIIWNAFYEGQNYNMLPVNIRDSAHFVFGDKNIQISGLTDGYEYLNGTWKIEKSSPDSWGVPIIGD